MKVILFLFISSNLFASRSCVLYQVTDVLDPSNLLNIFMNKNDSESFQYISVNKMADKTLKAWRVLIRHFRFDKTKLPRREFQLGSSFMDTMVVLEDGVMRGHENLVRKGCFKIFYNSSVFMMRLPLMLTKIQVNYKYDTDTLIGRFYGDANANVTKLQFELRTQVNLIKMRVDKFYIILRDKGTVTYDLTDVDDNDMDWVVPVMDEEMADGLEQVTVEVLAQINEATELIRRTLNKYASDFFTGQQCA